MLQLLLKMLLLVIAITILLCILLKTEPDIVQISPTITVARLSTKFTIPQTPRPSPVHSETFLTPEQLIRQGRDTYRKIRQTFNDIGFPHQGRGIVIFAGTFLHDFTSAFVLIRELRYHNCQLPIELWYRHDELDPYHVTYMKAYGVLCLNIDYYVPFVLDKKNAISKLALFLSSFETILYLDPNTNVLRDPTFLLDSEEFCTYGAQLVLKKQHLHQLWLDFTHNVNNGEHGEHRPLHVSVFYSCGQKWSSRQNSDLQWSLHQDLEQVYLGFLTQLRNEEWYKIYYSLN